MERAIADINDLQPHLVVCSGDLTTYGFKEEYVQAKRYLDRLQCESFVVITGTVSTLRLRGKTRPCYIVVEMSGTHVAVWRRYPFHGSEKIIQFDLETLEYEKYTSRIEGEVTAQRG